jgi:chromosome segregation ATPase
VTKRNHDFLYSLYNKNQEISEAKETLEIRVDARTKELKEVADTLEDKIKARTRELTEKISEMEKFQKIAIGRELKMVELKNEIERLKSQPPVVVEKIIELKKEIEGVKSRPILEKVPEPISSEAFLPSLVIPKPQPEEQIQQKKPLVKKEIIKKVNAKPKRTRIKK